jgi:hypothetical protein
MSLTNPDIALEYVTKNRLRLIDEDIKSNVKNSEFFDIKFLISSQISKYLYGYLDIDDLENLNLVSKTIHKIIGQRLFDVCNVNIKKTIDEYKDGDKVINFQNINIKMLGREYILRITNMGLTYDDTFNVSSYGHIFNIEYVTSIKFSYGKISVDDMLRFVNLREIIFSQGLYGDHDMSYLKSFKSLEIVKIERPYYGDLSILKEMRNLKVLKLFITKNNSSIIKDLENLKDLTLTYSTYNRTIDIFTITLCKNLKRFTFIDEKTSNYNSDANYLINFERCERLKHVTFGTENSPIINPIGLRSIKTMILENCKHILDDENVKYLTNVTSLRIRSRNGYDCDVKYIKDMTSLKILHIDKYIISSDIDIISSVKNLKILSVTPSMSNDSFIENVHRLTRLTSLNLKNVFINDLNFITPLINLQHLTLDVYFNKPVKCLRDIPLKTIVFGYHFNQDIDDLPTTLESVTFGLMFNKKIDRLKDTKGLKFLTLGTDFNKSLAPLYNLQHFEILIINNIKDIDYLSYIKEIPHIKNLKRFVIEPPI